MKINILKVEKIHIKRLWSVNTPKEWVFFQPDRLNSNSCAMKIANVKDEPQYLGLSERHARAQIIYFWAAF